MARAVMPAQVASRPLGFGGAGIDRRGLLIGGTAALVGALLLGRSIPAPWAAQPAPAPLELPSLATLAAHVGSVFTIHSAEFGTTRLTLVDAVASHTFNSQATVVDGDAFSMLLEAAKGSRLVDGTYRLDHAALALPPLYLSRIGRGARVQDFEAIVDRRTVRTPPSQQKAG